MATTKQYFKVKNGLEFPRQDNLTVTDNGGPSIRPSLLLDFAGSKALDTRVTFARASTGMYYDKSVSTAEENLYPYSIDTQGSLWGLTITRNTYTNPFGVVNAVLLTEDTGSNGHSVEQYAYTNETSTVTYSVYAKIGSGFTHTGGNQYELRTRRWLVIAANPGSISGSASSGAVFDLVTGTVVATGTQSASPNTNTSASIVELTNGWFRCSITTTITTANSMMVSLSNVPTFPSAGYGRNYYTGSTGVSVVLWGFQIERRSQATDLVETSASPVTNKIPTLTTAAANIPRFDHDPVTLECRGLLFEDTRTNLLPNSNGFDVKNSTTAWNVSDLIVNSSANVCPNGTTSATKLIPNTTSALHYALTESFSASVGTNAYYTASVYAKAAGYNYISIEVLGYSTYVGAGSFNLSNGTTITNRLTPSDTRYIKIEPVGNGWYRCSVTCATDSGSTYVPRINILVGSDGTWNNYAGDGNKGVLVWGAQMEYGQYPSTYIPTTGTFLGRSGIATFKGTNGLLQYTTNQNQLRQELNFSGGSTSIYEPINSNLLITNRYIGHSQNWGLNSYPYSCIVTAPDGSLTGSVVRSTGSTIDRTTSSGCVATSTGKVFSMYIKKSPASSPAGTTLLLYNITTATTVAQISFNWNGTDIASMTTVSGTGAYSYVGNGWWRCSIRTSTGITVGNQLTGYLYPGGPGLAGEVYAWGAQVEPGTTLTSFIPSKEVFTGRASRATFYNQNGYVTIAESGMPRVSYNPQVLQAPPTLIVENQSTNLTTCSDPNSPVYVDGFGGTYAFEQTTSLTPAGTADAKRFYSISGVSTGCVQFSQTAGTTYTYSIWVKTITSSAVSIRRNDNNVYSQENWTINVTPGVWTRVSVTFTTILTGSWVIGVQVGDVGAQNEGVYLWGAQAEGGWVPSTYIPTYGAATTRVADQFTSTTQSRGTDIWTGAQQTRSYDDAYISASNFKNFYNPLGGTIYYESILENRYTVVGNNCTAVLTSGIGDQNYVAFGNRVGTGGGADANQFGVWIAEQSSQLHFTAISNALQTNAVNKQALSFDGSTISSAVNGLTAVNEAASRLPAGIQILDLSGFYNFRAGTSNANAWKSTAPQTIKKISIYTKKLTLPELVSLTS